MEGSKARLRRSRETPDASQSTRLSPPLRTGIYEDHGSSFQTPDKKPTKMRDGSGSEDEIDCFSQKSQADEKFVVGKQTDKNRSEYDLHVIEDKSRVLKKLKFKKTKVEVKEEKLRKFSISPTSPLEPKTSSREPRRRHDRENYIDGHESPSNIVEPNALSPISKTPRQKPRPRPLSRPRLFVPLPTSREMDNVSIPLEPIPATDQTTRTPSEIPLPSPTLEITAGGSRRMSPSPSTTVSSSLSSNTNTSSSSSRNPPLSSTRSLMVVSSESTSRIQQSFPVLSPLNSPKKRTKVAATKSVPIISSLSRRGGDVREFPSLSPLSTNKSKAAPKLYKKDKGKRKADALTPFPMSTQDLDGISLLEDESIVGKHYARKRRLQIVDEASTMVNNMDLYEEEDSLFMSPSIDPNTLCPYCDSPLPLSPTPFFLNLLESTLPKSYSDPRSTNPLGRKAPLSTFVAVCQRHDFEVKVLPEAEVKGWPKTINWETLGDRVSKMESDLEEIIQDSGEADLRVWIEDEQGEEGDLMTTFASKGPRIQSVFWREAMKSLLKSGARAMADVRGQFQNFEKSQPGYYGELGQIIIQQTLFNMFPPDSFDLKLIKPFTANEFIQRILVPEVALRLIMEDRGLKGLVGAETALPILRESTTYGVTMFPEDSGENMGTSVGSRRGGKAGVIGVGDRIVMERAMKRRREIESGEVEALFGDAKEGDVTGEEKRKGRRRGMKRTAGGVSDSVWSQDSELEEHGPKPPRDLSKKVRGLSSTDDDDTLSIDSRTDENDSKSVRTDGPETTSRPRRNTKSINYDEDSNTKNSRAQRPGRPLSKLGSRSSSQTRNRPLTTNKSRRVRSPSPSERTPHKSRDVVGSKVQQLGTLDMDLCSTDVDSGSDRETYKPRTTKTSANKFQRSLDKQKTHTSSVAVDLDVNTPLPNRRGIVMREDSGRDEELTPRPVARKPSVKPPSQQKQQTVLALARARDPNAGDTDRVAGKTKKSGLKKPIQNEWYHNIRASIPQNSSSSESESSVGVAEAKSDRESRRIVRNGEGTSELGREESFSWLLDDDPPSQES